jgi:AraC family transcriptional regulator
MRNTGRSGYRRLFEATRFHLLGESCYPVGMDGMVRESGNTTQSGRSDGPASRCIASGHGWSVSEFICDAGPGDRPFEEKHDAVSIAVVLEGSFNYVSDKGRAMLHPGALLLGNHGSCYQCGHDHSTGDRCISVQFSPDYFAEIAATASGSSAYRFPVAMLPVERTMISHAAVLDAQTKSRNLLRIEEDLIGLATAALCGLSGFKAPLQRISARDERRVSRVLRHIEEHADTPLDLDQLCSVAAMSKFHFLRVFRRSIGMTPYQFLLGLRLRRAAASLLTSDDAISRIAFEAGFGDLSTFNALFRTRFGMTPMAFRRKGSPL